MNARGPGPVIALMALMPVSAAAAADSSPWQYQGYVDVGYAASNRDPANNEWRSKSTTSVLNSPELFLALANVRRVVSTESRLGFEFGLQAGHDSKNLVTSAPPPAKEPIDNADTWRHLYRANVSYLFGGTDEGGGVQLTGGLINSYIGWESYLAIDNPNYTRAYILDNVPYFMIGAEAMWDTSDTLDLRFFLVNGWNYLTDPNDGVSTGFQAKWRVTPRTIITQNFYYGPDQQDTSLEYWRFFSDTIIRWKSERFLLAAALDFGTEKQARLPGEPRARWSGGAIWAQWLVNERISLAFRPEFYRDDDGVITGASQKIQAYTGTFKYQLSPRHQRLVGTVELRYDKSTGPGGGFNDGPNNALVPDQTIFLLGLLWTFER